MHMLQAKQATQTKQATIDRRRFLRCAAGGLGTAVALPPLEAMFTSDAAFAAGAGGPPRFWAIYQPNGYAVEKMWPAGVTGLKNRSFSLQGCSLEPLDGHKTKISVFKHLENASKGGSGNAHLLALASYLTGARVPNDDVKTYRISVDQYIAEHYAKMAPTRKHSLQLSANNELDAARMEYNNLLKNALSFDRGGRLLPNRNDLRATFDDLFAGSSPEAANQQVTQRRSLRKSVLDYVLSDSKELGVKLGAEDKKLVDGYFEGIRDLERELSFVPAAGQAGACVAGANTHKTIPTKWDRVGEHWNLTAQLVALAFRCEATRSVSYLLGGEAAGATYPEIGINAHVHNTLSHSTGGTARQKYAQVDRYHAECFAKTLDVFERTPLGAGTLLDNTVILWGTGLGDGASHQQDNLMAVLAGNVGRMKHGAFYDIKNQRKHAVLLNTILHEMAVPTADGFGDAKSADLLDLA